jgi:ATP-binding cassette subfamily B protein
MQAGNPSIMALTRAFWDHLAIRRKRQLGALMVLMVLASFAEVLSLGAILPFLGILTSPEKVFLYPAIQPLLHAFSITTAQALLLPITIVFIVAALLAGGMRLLLLYANTWLSYAIGADFSYEIYRRTLHQPYSVHVSRNSSQIISGVGKAQGIVSYLVMPLLTIISSAWILLAVLATLFAVNPSMTLAAFLGFGVIYAVVIMLTRRRLGNNSRRVSRESTQVLKVLQEGLGGIRDVLIDGTQAEYCRNYLQANNFLRDAQASTAFISKAPRFGVEALGIVFIAILAYAMARMPGGVTGAITTLGVLALGAQRLLPVLQQSYSSIVTMRGGKASLSDALDLLSQPIDSRVYSTESREVPFTRGIKLSNLSFRYAPDGPFVLRDLNLTIQKGSRTGFIGQTGSGKSTLLDIVMGLLSATHGSVNIDDIKLSPSTQRAWQNRIAHVPQSIYLADSSIAENIAFGTAADEIDMVRVRHAANQAQIADYIETLADQYQTHVGERGVRLSGGQRQRIGIARALYKQAEVIVFDEATSALDNETEQAVMSAIDSLGENLTILIIAHRLTTLRHCDQIIELSHGRLIRSGSYDDIIISHRSGTM